MKIALLYATFGPLGHVVRVNSLMKGIQNHIKNSEIKIIQIGKKSEFVPFDSHHFPFSISPNLLVKKITSILQKFNPDIFITEFFPIGRWELVSVFLPVIKFIKHKTMAKLYSSSGYISPDTSFAWKVNNIKEIFGHYDKIFIHAPKQFEILGLKRYLKLQRSPLEKFYIKKYIEFVNGCEKIKWTGYVYPSPLTSSKESLKINTPFVLVSRGGGNIKGRSYSKLILTSLKIAKKMKEYTFVIVPGITTHEKEMKIYKKLASQNENVVLRKFLWNFEDVIKKSNLCISLCGYNTSLQYMKYRKKSVVSPVTIEQKCRAFVLKRLGISETVEYKKLNEKTLQQKINAILTSPIKQKMSIPLDIFSGINNFVEEIKREV